MSEGFDPYYRWLGIPPKEQPPNHYRLLGLELFEADPALIDSFALRHTSFLRDITDGPHLADAQRLLNELAAARRCLLDPQRKAAYDDDLRARLAAAGTLRSDAAAVMRPPPERATGEASVIPTSGLNGNRVRVSRAANRRRIRFPCFRVRADVVSAETAPAARGDRGCGDRDRRGVAGRCDRHRVPLASGAASLGSRPPRVKRPIAKAASGVRGRWRRQQASQRHFEPSPPDPVVAAAPAPLRPLPSPAAPAGPVGEAPGQPTGEFPSERSDCRSARRRRASFRTASLRGCRDSSCGWTPRGCRRPTRRSRAGATAATAATSRCRSKRTGSRNCCPRRSTANPSSGSAAGRGWRSPARRKR